MKKLVGLTGKTGAGKTTICKYLREKGAYIIDGDIVARQVLEEDKTLLDKLNEAFGDVLNGDGSLNRRALASKAFCDENSTNKLNSIIHPAINDAITKHPVNSPASINIPELLYDKYIPIDCTNANIIVIIFVYLLIFLLPSSPPSLVILSHEGIIIANNWTTIDDVIYGLIDIANIENLEKAPPDIKSIRPDKLPVAWEVKLFKAIVSIPGTVI